VLARKLRDALVAEGHTVKFQGNISEKDVYKVIQSKKDYTIAYMHIMRLTIENRKGIVLAFDKILIAPQAEYLLPKVIKASDDKLTREHFTIIPGKAYRNVAIDELLSLVR